jgi:hypothetical protein
MKRFLQHPHTSSRRGVALIFWLGVLAVAMILLAFLLPALLREIDFAVARDESATLRSLGNTLKNAIQHQSYIPAYTNWGDFVASETGMNVGSITNNPRNRPRLLLIDGGGCLSNGVPYIQTSAGTTAFPFNARVIIATSLGKALPISAGVLSAASFSSLWNAAEGTVPTGAPWSTWTGQPDDLKLERINLMPLFVTLYLSSYFSTTNGAYSIGNDATIYWAPYANPRTPQPPTYYLAGTGLKLYNVATNGTLALDSSQILNRDGSFLYENNLWKSSSAGGIMPGGVDISGVVATFLNAVPNTNARNGADQQRIVIQSMMNYMSNYMVWANGNFTDANMKNYLKSTVQPNMIGTVQDLFMGSFYATNAAACE